MFGAMRENRVPAHEGAPGDVRAAETSQGGVLPRLRAASFKRLGGLSLYNLWLLATFYNTFLFLSATDQRAALYLNQICSLGALALTLAVFPTAVKHADKWVLSWRCSRTAGVGLALFTGILAFLDSGTVLGRALIVVSAVGTGVCSGVLFLGWGRLYADVGPRLAMFEIGVTWIAAGLAATVLSHIPAAPAAALVVVGAYASAVLLRRAALDRPVRPQPAHTHRLQRRTRRMFARGLAACAGMGFVAGFSDVICGFRFVSVPMGYETGIALSCTAVALAIVTIVALSQHDFVAYAYRLVTLLLAAGCLLTPFISEALNLSNMVVFGAYTGFVILLCVVCIDVSNYFDQAATRTFGTAFFALYAGELVGTGAGHIATDVVVVSTTSLDAFALLLTMAIVFANLFLFTEKDLTETSLGEMTDDDTPDGVPSGHVRPLMGEVSGCARAAGGSCAGCANGHGQAGPSPAGGTGSGEVGGWNAEERIACITALFVECYALTPREAEVLPLVIKGRTIARIQEELHISQGTVSTHIRHIYQKAGAHNRQALLDLIDEIPEAELARMAAEGSA